VRQNGMALMHVPYNLKTAELCLEAVKRDGTAIEYVPEALRYEVLRKLEQENRKE